MTTWADPPPAGWYPNPEQPTELRWWDGTGWTEHTTGGWQPPMAAGPSAGSTPPGDGLTYLLPVNRDGFAIASGYLGLLSLLPNPFTSTAAIACGWLGLRRTKSSKRLGRGRAWFGIVAGVLSIAVFSLAVAVAATRTPDTDPRALSQQIHTGPYTAPVSGSDAERGTANPPAGVEVPGATVPPGHYPDATLAEGNLEAAANVLQEFMRSHPGEPIYQSQLDEYNKRFAWDIPGAPIAGPGTSSLSLISLGVSPLDGARRHAVLALPGTNACYYLSITEGVADRYARQYGIARGPDAAKQCFVIETSDGVLQARRGTAWARSWPAG